MHNTAVSGAREAPGRGAPALALAALAALLASGCCVLPLVLAVVGISGAWISQLRVLQPYSNSLIAVAVLALGVAAWRIFRPAVYGSTADVCDVQGVSCRASNKAARRWFWLVALLALMPVLVPLLAPLLYD
jgi:mercuric ion transport protein